MWLLCAVYLLFCGVHAHVHHQHHDHHVGQRHLGATKERRSCGTRDPTPQEISRDESKIGALKDAMLEDVAAANGGRRALFFTEEDVMIETYVHIIHAVDGTGDISDDIINQQMIVLNDGFSTTSIQFNLMEIDHIANDEWFFTGLSSSREYKTALHVGDASTLNLYFTNLREDDKEPALGFATFAFWIGIEPLLDGVVCDYTSVPGGLLEGFNLGKTTVHEVGHWLGLFHTFSGDCNDGGDFVSDTASHVYPTSGCPVDDEIEDGCPDDGLGNDPVNNFMDYSDDRCLTEFTPGQSERMYLHWLLYRQQNDACSEGRALLELEVQLDENASETSWSLESNNGETIMVSPECGPYWFGHSDSTAIGFFDKDVCIPSGSYVFTMADAFGDGLETGSGYTLTVDGNVIQEGGDFEFSEVTTFDVNAGSIAPTTTPEILTPMPTPQPTVADGSVAVEVLIAFDGFAFEIGWLLECGGIVLADNVSGTYGSDFDNTFVRGTFSVIEGEVCTFTIYDSLGDGLFCDTSPYENDCGFFAVFVNGGVVVEPTLFLGDDTAVTVFVADPPPPTIAPTVASPSPTITASPSADVVSVSFLVIMDTHPEETGLSLTCGDLELYNAPVGTFSSGLESVAETFDVPRDAICLFVITDSFGDGLSCFTEDACGFYLVFYGTDPDVSTTWITKANFELDQETVSFTATGTVETPVPTISPSIAPTMTAPPTFIGVTVQVTVLFDAYPSETGILLTCADETLLDFPSGSFGGNLAPTLFEDSFVVIPGSRCMFELSDSLQDGLCSSRLSSCGRYEVKVDGNTIDSGSEFTDVVAVRFVAGVADGNVTDTATQPPTPKSSSRSRTLSIVVGVMSIFIYLLH